MFGMKADASVVPSTVGQSRLQESRRSLAGRCFESDMEAFAGRNNSLIAKPDGKFIAGTGPPIADRRFFAASAALLSKDTDVTKGSEGGVIKDRGTCEISHRERKMMQHTRRPQVA